MKSQTNIEAYVHNLIISFRLACIYNYKMMLAGFFLIFVYFSTLMIYTVPGSFLYIYIFYILGQVEWRKVSR